ncbi:MAG: helix-turn-helix domain-containing protein [Elusimicrobiota bacterium]|jgi:DNA-binding phage protein|nr:helix-turn-helix domain-containing protein [Elusimicrobiota bacterium]
MENKKELKKELLELGLTYEDCKICKEDFATYFAKRLSRDPQHIKSFKKKVVKEYNETKDLTVFLHHLKVIALAEKRTIEIAQKLKMKRPNIYRILSKESNPSFLNLQKIASNLGIKFKAVCES